VIRWLFPKQRRSRPGPVHPHHPVSFGLEGAYDFNSNQIIGWVRSNSEDPRERISILVRHKTEVLAHVLATKHDGDELWRFTIKPDVTLTPRDFLAEAVEISAIDHHGGYMTLRIEGSAQLALIREAADEETKPYLSVSFDDKGNAADFILDGWSFQEATHIWTLGHSSGIAFAPPIDGNRYTLELLLWPFTVFNRHPEQRLDVLVNDENIGTFFVRQQVYLKCRLPLLEPNKDGKATVRFLHPDAARPSDFQLGDDARLLSFAFKKLKIMPSTI
jgi:hypothetical protein